MSTSASLDDIAGLLRELVAATRPPSVMIDREQFAELLAVGASTFDRLRAAGDIGPQPVRIGGALRWYRAEVVAWLARRDHRGELFSVKTWPPVWRSIQES